MNTGLIRLPATASSASALLWSGSARLTSTRYSCTPPSSAVTATMTGSSVPLEKSTTAPALSVGLPLKASAVRPEVILPTTARVCRVIVAYLLCAFALTTTCTASKGTSAW